MLCMLYCRVKSVVSQEYCSSYSYALNTLLCIAHIFKQDLVGRGVQFIDEVTFNPLRNIDVKQSLP